MHYMKNGDFYAKISNFNCEFMVEMTTEEFLREFTRCIFIYSAIQNGWYVKRLSPREIRKIYRNTGNRINIMEIEEYPVMYEFSKSRKVEQREYDAFEGNDTDYLVNFIRTNLKM